MALDMRPDLVDTPILCIQAECTLRAAPLETILAKIARSNIVHNAPAPLMTTLPHPLVMLSTLSPYDLCNCGPFCDGGEPLREVPCSCIVTLTFTYL
jgi:hypothetical protein